MISLAIWCGVLPAARLTAALPGKTLSFKSNSSVATFVPLVMNNRWPSTSASAWPVCDRWLADVFSVIRVPGIGVVGHGTQMDAGRSRRLDRIEVQAGHRLSRDEDPIGHLVLRVQGAERNQDRADDALAVAAGDRHDILELKQERS